MFDFLNFVLFEAEMTISVGNLVFGTIGCFCGLLAHEIFVKRSLKKQEEKFAESESAVTE